MFKRIKQFYFTGIWSELPFYILETPEKWRLTSVITLIAQIAQIFPMTLYLFLRHLFPKKITYRRTIYFKLVVETAACFMLSFFWNKTISIGSSGNRISIGLYLLSFSISLLGKLIKTVVLNTLKSKAHFCYKEVFRRWYFFRISVSILISNTLCRSILASLYHLQYRVWLCSFRARQTIKFHAKILPKQTMPQQ